MSAQFAYSLNGENYLGTFASRETAKSAAMAKASGMIDPPATVWVGERCDARAHVAGHAWQVISAMRNRAWETTGDEANTFLARITDAQVQELDADIARAISAWLEKYHLTPCETKLSAISEHPVPMPHRGLGAANPDAAQAGDEVHDLGVDEIAAQPG